MADVADPPFRPSPLRWLPVVALILATPVVIIGSVTYLFRHVVNPAADTPAARRLTAVGAALRTYAQAHEGRYPDDLTTLVDAAALTPEQVRTAADPGVTGGLFPDQYRGHGKTDRTVTNGTLLVYENPDAHADHGAEVLYADGSVTRLTADVLKAELTGRPAAKQPDGP